MCSVTTRQELSFVEILSFVRICLVISGIEVGLVLLFKPCEEKYVTAYLQWKTSRNQKIQKLRDLDLINHRNHHHDIDTVLQSMFYPATP